MKKLLYILLTYFSFSATAQTIEDWDFLPPITDNNETVMFAADTLSDYVGGVLQSFINGIPVSGVSSSSYIAIDGSVGVSVIGSDGLCGCDLADSGEELAFAILMNGETIVMVDVDPPVIYLANSFQLISYQTLTLTVDDNPAEFGCTDSLFAEYSMTSNIDDGSCSVSAIFGCMLDTMFNFNPEATVDDGSCIEIVEGCMDNNYAEYNEQVNTDDESCEILTIFGCTIDYALNYNILANTDDGSCSIIACPYPNFFEYNSNYTIADAYLCLTLIVEGCADETAENYNIEVNLDDGTCVIYGCMETEAANFNVDATLQDNSCVFYGCNNETAVNYDAQANENDGSCIIYGCVLSIFPNYNPEATVDDLSCNFEGLELFGCTDYNALNYSSQANIDNGTCIYENTPEDCTSSILEQDIPLYLPGGWTIFGFTCLEPLDVMLAFSNVVDDIIIVKDPEGIAYLPEWNFNGIGDLLYSRGYQIKTTDEILDFSFCPIIIISE